MPKIIDYVLKTSEGDVSQPFEFGLRCHLVRVIKIEPGDKTLEQSKDEVRKHTLVFLLDFLDQKSAQNMPLVWQAR